MKIGNQHFDLKNMSKNQRKLLKAIKEKYEEALAEGVNLGDDIFGSFQIEGKIKSAEIERVKTSRASDFYQYNPRQRKENIQKLKQEDDEEYYRMKVENFLSNFTPFPYTRRGRRRKFSSGEQAMMDITRIFTNAMNQYSYKVLSAVIDSIPQDIKGKINNATNVYQRYDGIRGALEFLTTIDFSAIAYNVQDMDMEIDRGETYEDYDGDYE